MSTFPFSPGYGSNQVLTAAAVAADTAINASAAQMRIVNTGANIGYVRTYRSADGTQAATTADLPIPSGMATTVTKDQSHDRLSYISAAGTTLQVMAGQGL